MFGCELEKARAKAKGKEPQKEVVVNCGPLEKLRKRLPEKNNLKMDKIIEDKLVELANLAEALDDKNTVVVISGLLGSKYAGQDSVYADACKKCVKEVLMPDLIAHKN